jgi:2-polyprenyl-6-hydroxyphenyl methylase/3-demethylubiquinone-9 3-methyltransferase
MSGFLPELSEYAFRNASKNSITKSICCKICTADAKFFDVLDFAVTCNMPPMAKGAFGIPVYYYRCMQCEFIFTDFCDDFTSNQWTEFIYNEEYYTHVDTDYVEYRPRNNANAVASLLSGSRKKWLGLDYGGGHGRTAQILRDRGFAFECHDPFGVSEMSDAHIGQFNFCSAFEVAEHSVDPLGTLNEISSLCSTERLAVLFATHVHDGHLALGGRLNWWYAAPRNGHISLYSRASLARMANAFGMDMFSISETSHLFSRGYSAGEAKTFLVLGKLRNRLRRISPISYTGWDHRR